MRRPALPLIRLPAARPTPRKAGDRGADPLGAAGTALPIRWTDADAAPTPSLSGSDWASMPSAAGVGRWPLCNAAVSPIR
jgi:hypothetical protein